jgi:hypothetical protein
VESARTQAVAPLTAKLERANARLIDATLQSHMVAAGLQDPDLIILASRMPNAPKVTLSDDFEVVGAEEMVAAFKKWKPEFFRAPAQQQTPAAQQQSTPARQQQSSAGGEPPPSQGTPTTKVSEMTKEEYAKFKRDTLGGFRRAGAGSGGFGR